MTDFEEKGDTPNCVSEAELSNLIRDVDLSRKKAQFPESRLEIFCKVMSVF